MTATIDSPFTERSTELLTAVLLGDDHHREHGFWRRLIATEPFRRPDHPTPEQRLRLAYDRLRALNDALVDGIDGDIGDGPGTATEGGARLAADPRALAALHEWLGPVDPALTTVAGIHYNLFLGSLLDHDAPGRRDLSDFLRLRSTGTFLCTELAHGNDAAAIETTARYERARDGFVLHTPHAGAQKFMPNTGPAGGPKTGLVAARLLVDGADQGVFLFLVPLTDANRPLPGVRVRRLPERMGSPVDHCLTSFDEVFVGRGALLAGDHGRIDDDGVFSSAIGNRRRRLLASIGRVTAGKVSMSACAVGSARATLAVAVRYGGHRHVSGPRGTGNVPVMAHRSHHGPLVRAMATVFAMSLLHRRALDRWEAAGRDAAGTGREEAERLVAVAKGWITWQARSVIVECRERCGAQALLENNGMSALLTGVEGAITAEGDNLAIHAKAAAEMLLATEPAGHAAPLGGEPGELSDPRFLLGLLAALERIWFDRAGRRMGSVPHGDPLARWNAASGPALRGVEAHAHRQAAEAFADAAQQLPHGRAREQLVWLQRLFALDRIARDSGDLLASGCMTTRQINELPDEADRLIAALVDRLPELVDSFALPAELLADWPIAGAGYIDVHDDPQAPWHRNGGPDRARVPGERRER
ncbi:acyl-CoA dehydrogenase [Streptomyces sp. NPDC047985]|uniref:acyl-CoA dehydrogenase family protein n=1 Tax=unclassified Streptomyces TaxID=2593676 RepID=UPI00344A8851